MLHGKNAREFYCFFSSFLDQNFRDDPARRPAKRARSPTKRCLELARIGFHGRQVCVDGPGDHGGFAGLGKCKRVHSVPGLHVVLDGVQVGCKFFHLALGDGKGNVANHFRHFELILLRSLYQRLGSTMKR
uniref:Uncharacterized protein n=1 Tax=Ditylum brightwellii TaxID=49249 RepID=A0A7S4SQZ2_9STRA